MSSASVRLALFNSLYWSAVTFFVILATSVPVSALVVTWPAKTDSTVLKKELFPEEISPTIQSTIQPTWGDLTNQENIDVLDSCFSDYSMGLDLILQLFLCLHKLLKRMKAAVTFSAQGSISSIFLQGIFKISGGSQFSFLNGGELDLDGWRHVWLLWYDILTTPGSSSVGALKIFGALKYFILGFFFPPSFSFAPPSAFDILAGQQSVIVDSLLER